ncbi:hypothetical protein BN59_02105 [Legionella massiliensis]|uniref:Uncharacterized protein n=1 Tax=Legionella massiliensis TaxID=1034943 RepID=A0A078KTM6_9GAMM|nr:hypothetical protein [Legionella massiliensis]CDZ77815.1 hypothetical protein BN59_02105 [Legionella massiliensis]CEE13553.1 hypothetical protein BN1094_02105 [Legionella massiliensis]
MPQMFLAHRVPHTIDEMIALLNKCTPSNMSALKECLSLEDELSFASFVDAIAYPIQSYKITSASKLALFQEINRLYPEFSLQNQVPSAPKATLLNILKRMDPQKTRPVGLDALDPFPELPVSEKYRLALLGGKLQSPTGEQEVTGHLSLCKTPIAERWKIIASQLNRGLNDKVAADYQALLNLLYLEAIHVKKAWAVVQAAKVCYKFGNEHYATGVQNVVRLSGTIETGISPEWGDESQDDFAFAIQLTELLDKTPVLLSSQDRRQHRVLLNLYSKLESFSKESASPRVKYLLAHIRNQMAIFEYKNAYTEWVDFITIYSQNGLVRAFCERVVEDWIAPCNSILLNRNKKTLTEAVTAIVENRVLQGLDPQEHTDLNFICRAYQDMAQSQSQLYAHVYQLLHGFVYSKKSGQKMQYLKLLVPDLGVERVLPKELPISELEEKELSLNMLCELNSSINEEWPIPISAVPQPSRKQSKHTKQSKKISERGAASSSVSTIPEVLPDVDEKTELVNADLVLEKKVSLLSLPQTPAPFSYVFRVFRWFETNIPLDPVRFPEYVECLSSYQQLMIAYHAFTSSVDWFVIDMALQTIWNNPTTGLTDIRYVLPAEISIPELGKHARGVLSYCIGKRDGKLYHRFFTEKPTEEIVKKISNKAFEASDFPNVDNLSEDSEEQAEKHFLSPNPDETIVQHPLLSTVTIENKRTKMRITLFPVTSKKLLEIDKPSIASKLNF